MLHVFEGTIDDFRPLLGIKTGGCGCGAFYITEQDGHDPAFALHRTALAGCFQLVEQFLGHIALQHISRLRYVGGGGGFWRWGCGRSALWFFVG